MSAIAHPPEDFELGGRVPSSAVDTDRLHPDAATAAGEASSRHVRAGRRGAIIGVNLASFALIFESSALALVSAAVAGLMAVMAGSASRPNHTHVIKTSEEPEDWLNA